jgi:ABC-type phosphate/phosphonate transport system ATPase subunit
MNDVSFEIKKGETVGIIGKMVLENPPFLKWLLVYLP